MLLPCYFSMLFTLLPLRDATLSPSPNTIRHAFAFTMPIPLFMPISSLPDTCPHCSSTDYFTFMISFKISLFLPLTPAHSDYFFTLISLTCHACLPLLRYCLFRYHYLHHHCPHSHIFFLHSTSHHLLHSSHFIHCLHSISTLPGLLMPSLCI